MTTTSDLSKTNKVINFYSSPIGKKIITGITGLGLSLFVLFHMAGNLTLLASSQAYNQLAHFLESLGVLLYAIELVLLGLFIFHAAVGVKIRLNTLQARPVGYVALKSAGSPSKQSLSSRSMAITGTILLGFLVLHLWSFKFGTYYSTAVDGVEMRDLAALVIEKFHSPLYAFGYVAVMIMLAVHLRHGIWSAWQSIGVLNSKVSPMVYAISLTLAIAIAIGFIILPLAIYFNLVTQ